ncbi:nitrogenase iron-molybdenum cofactor biosynthesis protein NifN [Magnetospirillum sp. UT-4]|uniref:nitrogenase iron-molybdenum cofactor biosynthesis protein NifN n=1 Tax=Magnetospirillum sp. UT-4 TaxID=2681467 RepID=UPI00137E93FD|nr:nitrogenase iron-molybdenum cofactor biosynthesis protein NifN [Magnetospirillum sp. UT-4]CAA7615290.1 Nitrogenase iron-molybdenum cofactor biosynthesis protein NifN [Magnetospirillum sp. UT-4]
MALVINHNKPLSTSPLKTSAPLGAAMAFMGMEGSLPLFHGSQGCTAFALVMMVRHFREAIPLQTTAMNEVSTILGGSDQVEQALVNIVKRAKPKIIGLVSTALTETRGEDMKGDLKLIMAGNAALADTKVVFCSAPDFDGSLETGWGKAVGAMIDALVEPPKGAAPLKRVNVLAGCHLTPGDIEALKEIIEDFGLEPVILPDLSGSLDGHVPDAYVPTTLGGTTLEEVRGMGRAMLTIAVGEHMRISAEKLHARTGVPYLVLDRLTGLEAVDRLMVALSTAAAIPVPAKYRRQRSQLVDAMLDGHFYFAGRHLAIAGEPSFLWTYAKLAAELGAEIVAAVSALPSPHLSDLPCERAVIGDFEDLEDQILEAGGADLIIANSNGRLIAGRLGLAHHRAGFPVFDRLGAAHQTTLGYRGTRDLIFTLGNILMERPSHGHDACTHTEHSHGDPAIAVG